MSGRARGGACSSASCFDLDGVLLDSEPSKLAAWDAAVVRVLAPDPAACSALSAYNRANRGVPRRQKSAHAVAVCGAASRAVDALLLAYSTLLAQQPPAAMPGARRFTALQPGVVVVVTSAPRVEAVSHLVRLGFRRIDLVVDGSSAKSVALERLARSYRDVRFFGDAEADRAAAAAARVGFVAIGDRLPYHPRDLARGRDLRDRRLLEVLP